MVFQSALPSLRKPVLLSLLVLATLFSVLPAKSQSSVNNAAGNASGNTSGLDALLDRAAGSVFSKLKGKVPDNLQEKIKKEIDRQVSKQGGNLNIGNTQALLDKVNARLPESIKDRLPAQVLTRLNGVKMKRLENFSYEPGKLDIAHQMSLYTPENGSNFPLIIYVHGGGWTNRPAARPTWLGTAVKRGYAVATLNYRLAQEGIFPAQMEDLNTALRYIKANATKFAIDANRIGLWGTSAGGHLVALMGTSAKVGSLDIGGGDKTYNRDVKAVCDFCGPTDLYALATETIPGQAWDTSSPMASLSLFLGGQAANKKALADQASPMSYVSGLCPSILIVHGRKDNIVPFSQSEKFAAALSQRQAPVQFVPLDGAGHDIEKGANIDLALNFFDRILKN
ncbi:MAG: alpha/beta hydrolase [Candidatus Obscuribacterales bacterium]|nr:alpha/beta hydrolase [Candidatus Obscuribacterales bacterium]